MQKNYIKFLVFLLFIFSTSHSSAQYVNIPDANFVNFLTFYYPSCMSNSMMDTTCIQGMNITTLDCNHENITDLTGITYFTNLTSLTCDYNYMTTLPSLPNSLTTLNCNFNSLTSLPVLPPTLTQLSCARNQLTILPTLPSTVTYFSCSSNPQIILPASFPSLTYFDCNVDSLMSVPNLPSTLITFMCAGNQLPSLPSLPSSLITLNCWDNYLTDLPTLPATLTTLSCYNNLLQSLPPLSPVLINLYCYNNSLDSLPILPNTLSIIDCNSNQLTSLPSLPNSLTSLDCSFNQITTLPTLTSLLTNLNCNNNLITSLPLLNNPLTTLNCSYNQLNTLPTLPNSLTTLGCRNNSITILPSLNNSLADLNCSYNQLTNLPTLPNSLITLNCSYNLISTLPVLSNSLTILWCSSNQLTTLPSLPTTLQQIWCHSNFSLTSLPPFPNSLTTLNINYCSNLLCLPILPPNFSNAYFGWTGLTCLPNYGNFENHINLPLCDIFNTNGCEFTWNINGRVYGELNANCLLDTNESIVSNIKINLYQNGNLIQQTTTNSEGRYFFDVDTGTYTYSVDTTNLPQLVACPVIGFRTSVITTIDSLDYGMDFGVKCKPGFDVGSNAVVRDSGIFRPANFARVTFKAGDMSNNFGLHCATGVSGTVTVVISGAANYISPSANALTPIVNGDTLTYSIADFGTINFNTDFRILVQTDTTATLGNSVCFTVTVTPITGDNDTLNNNFLKCFTIVNSIDPNEKEVYPDRNILSGENELTYTIRFQNTGNAYTQHIYILDTLDANLDESTFELLAYSHQPQVQIIGNVLRFNFPNINLPDSVSDEPNSHGYLQFSIKLKDTVATGVSIQNTANIIFDFNPPVITNTVTNNIIDCSQIALANFTIPTSICSNQPLVSTANMDFPVRIDWYLDSVFFVCAPTTTFQNLTLGTHNIQMIASYNSCSQSTQQSIFIWQIPTQPVITANADTLSSSASNGNQWFLDGTILNGATQNTYIIQQSGWYTVQVTNNNGCSSISDSVFISPVGIEELNASQFSIYPNPIINRRFYISSQLSINKANKLEIYNILGEIIFAMQLETQNKIQEITLPSFSEGIYQCIITSGNQRAAKKISIIKE